MFPFLRVTFFLQMLWILHITAQRIEPPIPDTFSTFVEADLTNREADVEIYFDRKNNRAAVHIFSQNEMFIQIFYFDQDIFINLEDKIKCTVNNISSDPNELFFPYEFDRQTKKKKLRSAREFFRFPNPAPFPSDDANSGIPMYIYTVNNIDLPFYTGKDCELKYMFSRDYGMANCDADNCNSTLLGISLNCASSENGPIQHLYRFFRFENRILDEKVFEIPPGVHCDMPKSKPFPMFPKKFSFFYDVREKEYDISNWTISTRMTRKAVSYVYNESFTVDTYEDSTLTKRKVCDLSYGFGYEITPNPTKCVRGDCLSNFDFSESSQLPNILFSCQGCKNDAILEKTQYIGNRSSNNLWYDVWSTSMTDESSFHIVRDMYFTRNLFKENNDTPNYRLSHILEYVYDQDSTSKQYELIKTTYFSLNHFSFTRDWKTFDLSACYPKENRKPFEIKFSDSSSVNVNSLLYRKLVEALTSTLLSITGLPATRLSELKPLPASEDFILRGFILEDPAVIGWTKSSKNPVTMDQAFSQIQDLVKKEKLTFPIEAKNNKRTFTVTVFKEPESGSTGTFYTKGAMAGLGIAMTLIGALIGGISGLIYLRSRSK